MTTKSKGTKHSTDISQRLPEKEHSKVCLIYSFFLMESNVFSKHFNWKCNMFVN